MPWWAYLYLTIFAVVTVLGVPDDLKRPNKLIFVTGEIVTALFVFLFVAAYFHEKILETIGIYPFVMMIVAGIGFELMSAQRTLKENKNDPEFSEKENAVLDFLGLVIGNLFIVPGYVFGIMAAIRYQNA